jgi:NUMOD3 motif
MGSYRKAPQGAFLLTFVYKNVIVELTNINKYMNKYTKWYNNICKRGQNRVIEGYTEKHHIIPESFYSIRKRKGPSGWIVGDSDAIENITHLTDREHELAHYLLTKIHKDNKQAYFKVLKAYEMRSMVNSNQEGKRYFSSRRLAGVRAERAKLQSEAMKGEGNPNYGKKWTDEQKEDQRQKVIGNMLTKEQHEKLIKNITGKRKPAITAEHRASLKANHKSKQANFDGSLSEETRKRIGDKLRGRKQTEEEKLVRSLANMGKKREKKLCPHCDQHVAVNGYTRWHGDKCKLKP